MTKNRYDILGKPIEIGDTVTYPKYGNHGRHTGRIIGFRTKGAEGARVSRNHSLIRSYFTTDFVLLVDVIRWEPEDRI